MSVYRRVLMAVAATTCKEPLHYYANHELSAISPSSGIAGGNIDKAAIKEKPYKSQVLSAQRHNI